MLAACRRRPCAFTGAACLSQPQMAMQARTTTQAVNRCSGLVHACIQAHARPCAPRRTSDLGLRPAPRTPHSTWRLARAGGHRIAATAPQQGASAAHRLLARSGPAGERRHAMPCPYAAGGRCMAPHMIGLAPRALHMIGLARRTACHMCGEVELPPSMWTSSTSTSATMHAPGPVTAC